jgi:asparagine synthase (glutamine-hydrolysing)
MYSGLEARVPFADHRIVEYVWNVPWEMKSPNGMVKGLLREAGKGLIPDEILYRRKSPYPKTYHPDYEKLLGNRLLDLLSDSNAPIRPLVDEKKIKEFLSTPSDYGKPWYGQLMAGPQMIAYLLQINYWLEKYKIELV